MCEHGYTHNKLQFPLKFVKKGDEEQLIIYTYRCEICNSEYVEGQVMYGDGTVGPVDEEISKGEVS